jgi:hypothetical protein
MEDVVKAEALAADIAVEEALEEALEEDGAAAADIQEVGRKGDNYG